MTRPTARVLALLEILQNGGTRRASDLAERLEVDERTLRRYVGHLRDLDVPVESVRGRYGGYRLARGHRMPPLMLTDAEAIAIVLGLLTGRRAGMLATSAAAVESASAKVQRVLPRPLAARVGALLASVEVTAPPVAAADPETGVLLEVAEAARNRRLVVLRHTGRDGAIRERTVAPYGVVAHRGRWYVTGRDTVADEVRTFRLDRVVAATVTDEPFEVPSTVDPATQVLDALASTPWRYEVSVRVRRDMASVRRRLTPGVARVEPVEPQDGGTGWVRVRLRAERLDWVPGELARLDALFVVEQPEELRDHVRALGQRLLEAAAA